MQNVCKLVRRAKQERAMDSVNNRVVRNIFPLQDMYLAVCDEVFGYRADSSGSRNLANEHERRQDHADFHGER